MSEPIEGFWLPQRQDFLSTMPGTKMSSIVTAYQYQLKVLMEVDACAIIPAQFDDSILNYLQQFEKVR